eukprot:738496-Prymnesium_polylepis.1
MAAISASAVRQCSADGDQALVTRPRVRYCISDAGSPPPRAAKLPSATSIFMRHEVWRGFGPATRR